MEEARYWCHMCSQIVHPILELDIKCPFCQSGFVEEMGRSDSDFGALSLWAPILLGMMARGPRLRRIDDEDEGETEAIIRRRRRSSATILQLLQGIRAGMASEPENDRDRDRDRDREGEGVILINPVNQTIILQGSYDSHNHNPSGSLADYFIGPGLDLLLQHLAENDSNRYGTPPAQKEAIEALPTVKIKESIQCSVCLDDFEIGTEAKEMPCKHKFHEKCIFPWLELHSSCPVCRQQLPGDETKLESERSRNNMNGFGIGMGVSEESGDVRNGNVRRYPIPWPLSGLFSSSDSSSTSGSSSQTDES